VIIMRKMLFSFLVLFILAACIPVEYVADVPAAPLADSPAVPLAEVEAVRTVIEWRRSGGIAGICRQMTINSDATFRLEDCRAASLLGEGTIDAERWDMLMDWLQDYGSFQWRLLPPPGSADMFSDEYTFNGSGGEIPSAVVQKEINIFLVSLTSDFALSQPAESEAEESGIEGQVLVGPTCPGPAPSDPAKATQCADQPYQATIAVLDAQNEEVMQFESDAEGRFRTALAPGTYTLHPQTDPQSIFPRSGDQSVTVVGGQFTEVTIYFDTGIR
jgi:hypothetical protein